MAYISFLHVLSNFNHAHNKKEFKIVKRKLSPHEIIKCQKFQIQRIHHHEEYFLSSAKLHAHTKHAKARNGTKLADFFFFPNGNIV